MRDGEDLVASARKAARPARVLERVALLALLLYCTEMILGGPGFWAFGPVSIRKALFLFAFGALCLCSVGRRYQLQPGSALVFGLIVLFLTVWIVLIPGSRDIRQVRLAALDAAAFSIVLIAVLAYEFLRRHPEHWARLLSATHGCLVLVAWVNIALWAVGFSGEVGNELAQLIGLSWFTLGNPGADPPLYIGPMPDGFFRAMWITAIMYVPAFLFAIARRKWWSAVLFSLALFASYTRSLWLVALLGVAFAQLIAPRHRAFVRPKIILIALAACGLVGVVLASTLPLMFLLERALERMAGIFSDVSAQERFEQVGPLLAEWRRFPLFGAGFGASALLIRSEEAPYSYELTGLALLMKLGIVGLLYLAACFAVLWKRAMPAARARTPSQCAALASILALVGAGLTNPLLLNAVGVSVLAFLFIFLFLSRGPRRPDGPEHDPL